MSSQSELNEELMMSSEPTTPITQPVMDILTVRPAESLPSLEIKTSNEDIAMTSSQEKSSSQEINAEPPTVNIQEATPVHQIRHSTEGNINEQTSRECEKLEERRVIFEDKVEEFLQQINEMVSVLLIDSK